MTLKSILKQKKMNQYRLAQLSNVSKSIISDICSNTLAIEKCDTETIYRIAKALQVPMEELLDSSCEPRCSFELFKSQTCHRLKELGDLPFLIQLLSKDEISLYEKREWFPESLYLLAMVDYLSRIHNIALCSKYNKLRTAKLSEVIYPSGILSICAVEKSDRMKIKSYQESIPEFIRHNIVEVDIRNVV